MGDASIPTTEPQRREYRVDLASVRTMERTPVGGLRVEAGMVKRGQVLEYQRADGSTIRELVSPDAARASVAGAVVTNGHPATGMVTPSSWKRDAIGVVLGDVKFDGDLAIATFDVNDIDAIASIESGGLREVSLGYFADVVERPGVAADGSQYDAVQVARQVNHAALLPRGGGRAGADAALRMDGAAVQLGLTPEKSMKKERIDGVDLEIGSEAWHQAHAKRLAKRDADESALKEKIADLEKQLEAAKAELEGASKALDEKTEELESEEKMDARADARARLREQARSVLGDAAKLDGKASDAIRREVLTKLDGAESIAGKTPEQIAAYFDGRMRAHSASALGAARVTASPVQHTQPDSDLSRYLVRPGDL